MFLFCFHSDRVFGPATTTRAVYDAAAKQVVRGAMEGINGMYVRGVFSLHNSSKNEVHFMRS